MESRKKSLWEKGWPVKEDEEITQKACKGVEENQKSKLKARNKKRCLKGEGPKYDDILKASRIWIKYSK